MTNSQTMPIESTGEITDLSSKKIIEYKLGEYRIAISVNEMNEFVGVENISIDKSFYNYNSVRAEYDIARLYED